MLTNCIECMKFEKERKEKEIRYIKASKYIPQCLQTVKSFDT